MQCVKLPYDLHLKLCLAMSNLQLITGCRHRMHTFISSDKRDRSLLFLHHVDQAADVRQDLDDELIAPMEGELRVATPADAGGSPGDTTISHVRLCD